MRWRLRHWLILSMLLLILTTIAQGAIVPGELYTADRPVLVPSTGHSEQINSLAFSPDGKYLVSTGADRRVIIWNLLAKCPMYNFSLDSSPIMAFNPNGNVLAYGAGSSIKLWDLTTNSTSIIETKQRPLVSLAFAPDGHQLAITHSDGLLTLWDIARKQQLHSFSSEFVTIRQTVAFSPDGQTLACMGKGDKIVLWSITTGAKVRELSGHSKRVQSIAFSADGRTLASGSLDETIILWDVADGSKLATLPSHELGCLAISPDGHTLTYVGSDHAVIFWDIASRKMMNYHIPLRGKKTSLAYSADGRSLALACDRSIFIWDITAGSMRDSYIEKVGGVNRIAISSNERYFATGDWNYAVTLWDFIGGMKIYSIPSGAWGNITFSPDGSMLTLFNGNMPSSYDVTTGVKALTFPDNNSFVGSGVMQAPLHYSPNGKMLVSVASVTGRALADYKVINLWDSANGARLHSLTGHTAAVNCAAFSPDGRVLASGSSDTSIILWDTENGIPLKTLHGDRGEIIALAYHPDGKTLASVSTSTMVIWDIETGRKRTVQLETPSTEAQLFFTPDGKYLASGKRSLIIYDASTGQRLYNLNPGYITGMAISPDSQTLAVGDVYGTIGLWDITTGTRQALLTGHSSRVYCLVFTPDGRRLISGGWDGAVRLWDVAGGKEMMALYSIGQGKGYLAVTPQGYYASSLEVANKVVWRIKGEVYPVELFAGRFHRPDLVRRVLAGEDISTAPPLENTHIPPGVRFLTPEYGAEVTSATVDVTLEAGGRVPIQRIELTVNGWPVSPDAMKPLDAPSADGMQKYAVQVRLPPGEPRVRLRAQAYDTALLKSPVDELTLFRLGVKQNVGILHVLAVGINAYADPAIADLRYAVADATAFARAFEQQGDGKPYAAVKTTVLTDEQATLSNITFALRQLKDTATENDVAVVFLAGHGVVWQENFYFGSCNLTKADIPGTALDWRQVVAVLREVRAKRMLVLADTCHATAIVGDRPADNDALARKINKEAHRLVFTAAMRDELSIERAEWGHGAFTKALLEALAGQADTDKDRRLTFRELKDYVPGRVSMLTGYRQNPQLPFLDQFEPDAVLAHVLD